MLKQLRWIPMCFQVSLKVPVVTFEAVSGLRPKYLKNFLLPYNPAQPSPSTWGLVRPPLQMEDRRTGSPRSIVSVVAPWIWNSLPPSVCRWNLNPNIYFFKNVPFLGFPSLLLKFYFYLQLLKPLKHYHCLVSLHIIYCCYLFILFTLENFK